MAKFFCVESPFVGHCFLEEESRLEGAIRARVRLRPELTNSWGGAHGGLIVTLLDASITVAARYQLDADGKRGVATIDLTASFIGQAKSTLTSEARITAVRGSMIFGEAKAINEEGELVARASATLREIRHRT